MDLRTTNRETYITHKPPSSARSTSSGMRGKSNDNQVYTRRPMNGISQTSFDFRPYPKHRPPAAADMEPFQSQITIGNSFTPAVTLVE
jgi:hypothetical protein